MAIFFTIFKTFLGLWWLWLPVFLVALFIELWVKYLQLQAVKKINWILLEVRIPRNIEKTPKAMEQVFSGLHGILSRVKFLDKYWKGKVQEWFSFEIAGINGAVYFFIRTPEQFKNLVEAQIHSQYPEAEILETMDYTGPLAKTIPFETYSIGGVELILEKPDYYPIRTFLSFEERQAERRIDTMSVFLEVLSKLRPDENIFIQYLIQPISDKEWKDRNKGIEEVNKLTGKKIETKKGLWEKFFEGFGEFIVKLFQAPAIYPEWDAKKEEAKSAAANLSPGGKLAVEAIENKLSKLAFKVCIRFVYAAKKDFFNKANIAAVMGAFKQFNTVDLNAFKGNGKAGTSADQPRIIPFIKDRREFIRKIAFIDRFINRKMSKNKKDFVLSIEELATIYHYPILVVGTPTMRRVETKKAEPPISLPVE
ncbi:MAG: hypothetical protein Q7J30_01160 [Candidatus Azambacteria bacterium]|nr:hypothetical protein [Candidatus Azambacteria bacterium]